jgi:hypothetical protein
MYQIHKLVGIRPNNCILFSIIFLLFPTNFLSMMSVDKDFMFAPFLLLLTSLAIEIVITKSSCIKSLNFQICLIVVCFFVMTLRKNALIVPIIFFVICMIYFKQKEIRIILIKLLGIFLIMTILFSIFQNLYVKTGKDGGGIGEATGLLENQVAAVINDDSANIPDDIWERMQLILPLHSETKVAHASWDSFKPYLADYIKGYEGFFPKDWGFLQIAQFYVDWARLGLLNPGRYLWEYDQQLGGYYYPQVKVVEFSPEEQAHSYADSISICSNNGWIESDESRAQRLTQRLENCWNDMSPLFNKLRPQMTKEQFLKIATMVTSSDVDSAEKSIQEYRQGDEFTTADDPWIKSWLFGNPALATWGFLLILLILIWRTRISKKRASNTLRVNMSELMLIASPSLFYWASMLILSPCVMIRYMIPPMVCLPFLLMIVLSKAKTGDGVTRSWGLGPGG